MAAIAADPETKRWWTFADPCQEPVDSAAEGEWWTPAEEVFHPTDADREPPSPGQHPAVPSEPLRVWYIATSAERIRTTRFMSAGPPLA